MLKPITGYLDDLSIVLKPLNQHWGCPIAKTSLIRFQPLENEKEAVKWLQSVQTLNSSPRVISCQLPLPEFDWDRVMKEQVWMTWLNETHPDLIQATQLNLPLGPFYLSKEDLLPSEFVRRDMEKVRRLYHALAWEFYCLWLIGEMKQVLKGILLESTESYTLQGLLEDFIHEVQEASIRDPYWAVNAKILKMGSLKQWLANPSQGDERLLDVEKSLFASYRRALTQLKVRDDILVDLIRVLQFLETEHPEYLPLKNCCQLLHGLWQGQLDIESLDSPSWSQQIILLQLLNQELNVNLAIGEGEGESTHIAFAAALSITALWQRADRQQFIDLALNWDATIQAMHQRIAQEGIPRYEQWLKEEPNPEKKRMALAQQLQRSFLEALEQFCVPLARMKPGMKSSVQEGQRENHEYWKWFPPYQVSHLRGKPQTIPLLQFNADKGTAEGLTTAGQHMLAQLRGE
jgi:hypothetical protein